MTDRRNIGRFADAELIGQGGFGSVYRASDPEHGRDVAIKVLRGALGETERRRFDRERQTMGRLGSHPNIIPVHESGYTEHGEGFLVMELAPGGSLGDRLKAGERLPWAEAAPIAAAIARAAQAAHDQGVLHRDIKPDNILIDSYGNPRLTDFGIASVASNATATTSTTATLAHAAPEVLEGNPPAAPIDIYAIGSTLFNLIVGSAPFERPGEEGVTALITRALTQPPPDLRQWGVPDQLATVVERSLAKDAGDRQPSAAELADELTAAVAAAATAPGTGGGATGHGATVVAPILDAPLGTGPADPGATVTGQPPIGGPAPSASGTSPGPGVPPPWQPASFDAAGPATSAAEPGGYAGGGGGAGREGSGGRWILVAVAAVLLVIAGIGTALALTGGDDLDTTGTTGSSPTSEPTTDTTAPSTDTSETTATTEGTPSSDTTAPTTDTTAPTSETTATTDTTAPPPSPPPSVTGPTPIPGCGVRVVDGRTTRFNVEVCALRGGALVYRGMNRETGDGIELPACFDGGGVFVAQNEGFTYLIDTAGEELVVVDPQGDIIVSEPFLDSPATDFTVPLTSCA